MNKSHLIARLAEQHPHLSHKDVELTVNTILIAVAEHLSVDHRVEIRGFGSFTLNHRPARMGRNPKTGEQVQVPAKVVPYFKAGKELRERVDQ